MFHVDATVLLVLVAGILSLFFDYFPKVKDWFDARPVEQKKLITAGLAALAGAAVWGLQVAGVIQSDLQLDLVGVATLLYNIVLAVASMYGFHKQTKPKA